MHRAPLLLVPLLAAIGCARPLRTIPVDPDVTFAAHQGSRLFVVDRPATTPPGTVVPAGWLRGSDDPAWALRRDGQTAAAYWTPGADRTIARTGTSSSAPALGEVRASWDDNAIRLALEPAGSATLRSDVFTREGAGVGPGALSRNALTVLDVRGRYRAALRDATGAEVGWLRVRIGPYEPAACVYDGVLPAAVSEELAIAAMITLAGEIDRITGQAYDVYQGSSSDSGPLWESFPVR